MKINLTFNPYHDIFLTEAKIRGFEMKRTLSPRRLTYGNMWYQKIRPLYLKMGWTEQTVEHENTIVCKMFPPEGSKEKPKLIIACKDLERFNPENWIKKEK